MDIIDGLFSRLYHYHANHRIITGLLHGIYPTRHDQRRPFHEN
jgi:hypothetical protein